MSPRIFEVSVAWYCIEDGSDHEQFDYDEPMSVAARSAEEAAAAAKAFRVGERSEPEPDCSDDDRFKPRTITRGELLSVAPTGHLDLIAPGVK